MKSINLLKTASRKMKNGSNALFFKICHRVFIAIRFAMWLSIPLGAISSTNAQDSEILKQLRASRDECVSHFRINGIFDSEKAQDIETELERIVDECTGDLKAKAIFDLATIQTITNNFKDAIKNYETSAIYAERIGDMELTFDAWLGVARSHAYGTRDHGAAARAFELAIRNAGSEPTPKQRYEMAGYESQIQAGWGELAPALVNAINARIQGERAGCEVLADQNIAGIRSFKIG